MLKMDQQSPIQPFMPSFATIQGGHPVQPLPQQVLSVQLLTARVIVAWCALVPGVLLLPASERNLYRLSPTVMPNSAGFCNCCDRTYDPIGLEILREHLLVTAYDAETVRDRNVRSQTFIDVFEAALFVFKNARLSQPKSCVVPVVQQ